MLKCVECREFPSDRGKKCAFRWGCGDDPRVEDCADECPCFHPAGEPTEVEMLDWLEQNKTASWFMQKWCLITTRFYSVDPDIPDLRSAIREAMKGGKDAGR